MTLSDKLLSMKIDDNRYLHKNTMLSLAGWLTGSLNDFAMLQKTSTNARGLMIASQQNITMPSDKLISTKLLKHRQLLLASSFIIHMLGIFCPRVWFLFHHPKLSDYNIPQLRNTLLWNPMFIIGHHQCNWKVTHYARATCFSIRGNQY